MHILLADDHNLVREGLKPFLEQLDDGVTILEADDYASAVDKADAATSLDLIILDLMMPGMNGMDGLKKMAESHPDVPVVILSGYVGRDEVYSAIDAGAAGFVPKTISGSAMVSALRLVLAGERYLPSVVLSNDAPASAMPVSPGRVAAAANPGLEKLSARESQVLGLVIEGRTNKEIARELDLQEITVKVHVRNVYRKIGASNRAQAVKIALESGFQSTPAAS